MKPGINYILKVIFKVVVGLVKIVYPHVTVLGSTGILLATGVEGEGIDGTEMSLHPSNLLFKYQVEESGLEFPALCVGSCDLHRFLSSTKENVVLER